MTMETRAAGPELGALLSVYHHTGELAGLEQLATHYDPAPLDDAMNVLASTEPQTVNTRTRVHALQLLGRRGKLDEVDRDLATTVAQTAVAPTHRDDPAAGERLYQSIRSGQADGLEGVFSAPSADVLSPADRDTPSPLCEPVLVEVRGKQATRLWARYHSDRKVAEFAAGADPRNWPNCNPFFISMDDEGPDTPLPEPDKGYRTVVLETVGYSDWGIELKTYLEIEYSATEDRVAMTFSFAGSADDQIDVDSGYMLVFPDPNHPNKTIVESMKLVHFKKLTNQLAPFACKLGWVDTMMNMADCGAAQPGGDQ